MLNSLLKIEQERGNEYEAGETGRHNAESGDSGFRALGIRKQSCKSCHTGQTVVLGGPATASRVGSYVRAPWQLPEWNSMAPEWDGYRPESPREAIKPEVLASS